MQSKKMQMRSLAMGILAVSSVAIGSQSAMAAIDYGDFAGAHVEYGQVTESSTTNTGPLYGAPTVVADSITFAASQFGASSSNGQANILIHPTQTGATDTTQGDVTTTVSAYTGVGITGLQFIESGDYTLIGTPAGSGSTGATVSAPVTITINQVNGAAITPIVANTSLVYTPGSSFSLPANVGAGQIYDGYASVSLSNILAGYGISGYVTQVSWDLDNTLTATSQPGTVSQISKKVASSDSVTVSPVLTVPEPVSGSLLVLGMIGAMSRRRRA
jgi:hypothetical protein